MTVHSIYQIEKFWREHTKKGNEFFNAEKFSEALDKYHEGLQIAIKLNSKEEECLRFKIPFVQILVINYNNIANTYFKLNKFDKSEDFFAKVLWYLILQSKELPKKFFEIQNELQRAILTYQEFLDKTQRHHGRLEKIVDQIRDLQKAQVNTQTHSSEPPMLKDENQCYLDMEFKNGIR
jgi:tetratricopeptide (TPR) repeat protein